MSCVPQLPLYGIDFTVPLGRREGGGEHSHCRMCLNCRILRHFDVDLFVSFLLWVRKPQVDTWVTTMKLFLIWRILLDVLYKRNNPYTASCGYSIDKFLSDKVSGKGHY